MIPICSWCLITYETTLSLYLTQHCSALLVIERFATAEHVDLASLCIISAVSHPGNIDAEDVHSSSDKPSSRLLIEKSSKGEEKKESEGFDLPPPGAYDGEFLILTKRCDG
jgi:hypothetical protein